MPVGTEDGNPFLDGDTSTGGINADPKLMHGPAQSSGTATTPAAPEDFLVWAPPGTRSPGSPVSADHPQATTEPRIAASNYYGVPEDLFTNDQQGFDNFAATLKAAGYGNNGTLESVQKAWMKSLKDASKLGTREDPYSFVVRLATPKTKPGGSGSGGGGGGSTAYTGPTSRVDLTNEGDAHVILNNALSQYLGRQATDQELAAFKQKLNATESANPRVSTTSGAAQQNTVLTGGVNQQQEAIDFAKSRNDYAEVTADTTLMGWFMDALGGGN